MRVAVAAIVLGALAGPVRAELKPEQVGVIAMADSPRSQQVAQHFLQARGVPKSQLFLLQGGLVDELPRAEWNQRVRPALRQWLAAEHRAERIRCLVTTLDVPLKIGRRNEDDPISQARREFLQKAREERVREVALLLQTMDSAGAEAPAPARQLIRSDTPHRELALTLNVSLKNAQQRLANLPPEKRKEASAIMDRVILAAGGVNIILHSLTSRDRKLLDAETAQRIEFFRGNLQGLQDGLQALGQVSDSVSRDTQIMHLLQKALGVLGTVEWIDNERDQLRSNETYASFDSELSLLLLDEYPLFRWQPNLLHYNFDVAGLGRGALMVSRLAAPTPELAMKLVDAAIATEKTGLTGRVYLDARGMDYNQQRDGRGSNGEYDQSLRELAERLQRHTTLSVTLDNRAELFAPGACPEAALYCGWYSLAAYVDSFQWKPGAVAYHLASLEAQTLSTPGSKVWCNALLERGVAATLGPVYEPYLLAFPLPDDFFSLLLTGRYTLVETYYRTNPFNSWTMVLVGDPFYNPFKAHPQLTVDQLPGRMLLRMTTPTGVPVDPAAAKPAPKP